MSYISSYISIKQENPSSSRYFITLNKVYLDEGVKEVVISKLQENQEIAEKIASRVANKLNKNFFVDTLGEIPAASFIRVGYLLSKETETSDP